MAIVIPIVTDYVDKGMKAALTDIKKADGAFGKMNAAWAAVGPAALAAGAAVGAFAIKLGIDGVQAAIEEEKELAKLNTTLANLGFASATDSVSAFVDAQARATTFSDSDLRPALANLATATNDVKAAQDLLVIAMDASTGSGKSLDSVSTALEKAYNGNTTSLSKMFPWLDKNRLATEGMDYATAALAERFSGQATAAADTWAGRLGNVSEAFDELKEAFGKGFLDGLSSAEGGTGDLTTALYDMQPVIEDVGKAIGTFTSDLLALIKEITAANKAFQDWRLTLEGTPWGKIIDTIALSFERLTSPLKGILALIDGIKSGIESLKNLSIPSIPGLNQTVRIPAPQGGALFATAPTVNVTVNGAIDPVGTARQIRRILSIGAMRGGSGA